MATLAQFLQVDGKVDSSIVSYITKDLKLESVSDFANFWASDDYQRGVQTDVVEQVKAFKNTSLPTARLQIARLRAAWKLAQDKTTGSAASFQARPPASVAKPPSGEIVGMGWTSPEVTTATWDGLWAALVEKARNPIKFKMDVSDVTVADRPGYLARSMIINPTGKRVEEHIYASERKGEIIYRLVDPETKRETDDERVIAVKEGPLRMEFFHRHVSDGFRMYWKAPVDSVVQMIQELAEYATRTEGKGTDVGLGARSEEIKGVSHDALWRSMMLSIREPARFFPCSGVSIKECNGFVQRTITAGSETYIENIYSDEPSCEIIFRKLVNGAETDVERVVALRTFPLQIEFHQRNQADGFRVHWAMPKSAPLSSVEAFVQEARRMDASKPSIVGYGITSDPIRDCSYDSLLSAAQLAIKEPWRTIEVDQTGCSIEERQGYTLRKMKLKATGECVTERITVNEEIGTITYNKCDPNGLPGDVERVLAVHTPLRLEFYERSAQSGLRVDWKAPYVMASDTFSNLVKLAVQIETTRSDVVGYGLASKPISGLSQDAVWKGMLFAMRNPADCGLKVDQVSISDKIGYMQRSMRILGKPGSPTVTDNLRIVESALEITYRPVINGVESAEERVFALRTDPLRFEMFCRRGTDNLRLDWQVPRSICTDVFDKTLKAANGTLSEVADEPVGMGWTSPEVTTSTWDGLWAALIFKARNPQKFNMDVSDVTVADRPGYLARSMIINSTGKRVEEHIYASERKGEVIYRLVDPQTKRETDDERVIAVKEGPLRMEFFHRHVSDGFRMYWKAPVASVKAMIKELVEYAATTEAKGSVVGLGIRSEEVKGVSHDALWRSMMLSIREPARFFPCSGVSIKECNGFVQRTITAGSETYIENIYSDEPSCEVTFRKLVNGAETDVERVVALRTHPLQMEFHQRNVADGFRVQWDMPKSAPLSSVEAFVQEAKRMEVSKPAFVGYGITSDPILDCSYDSLLVAAQLAVKEPWRAIEVDQTGCSVKDCPGHTLRKMKLKATGEIVTERITINEEIGMITYNKCDANGSPGDVERVLAIHTPLRLEFFERSARSGLRVDWKAPYGMASDTFSNIVQLARQIETSSSDVISYGIASKPIVGASQDGAWKAMLYAMRKPAECGLNVDNVAVCDKDGFMQRTMRLAGKPGSPTVTDNIRVNESAQEIAYRPVVNNIEGIEERIFALRTDPLRFEMYCRNSKDEMRLSWQAPRSIATEIFEATAAIASRSASGTGGFCEKTGLELGGSSLGGALSAEHVAHLDEDVFKGGLHKPKFHEEGLHMPHTSGGKTYETGFHYLLEVHELGGKNKDGGFGGPLCADPFSKEIQDLCEVLLGEAQNDKTLAFNAFKDPCPMLTRKQVELCKGFDYGDKTLTLPCGALPWPTGLPAPGYVPKTNPLHGRWITASGGQAAFIKKAIEAGMLGAAEAHKITADTDHHQTGGMFLRISQNNEVCTVDASIAKFARGKRTWKSGHYFYEPLVSGGNLLGVWVLPEEYRKIGFFWEMESGRCFRIERRAFERNGVMIMRQSTEFDGKISFVFYVKVSNDPESQPIPLQSRDFTALAGHDNVPDNLGNPYPCTAKDLDFPTKRDTWMDKNEEEMKKQKGLVHAAFANVCDNGFEAHDNEKGGALNATHVEAMGKEHFQDGLHKPKFHDEGLHKPMVSENGKTYATGFHYLLEAHELGGKNEDGGFGGPLCQDPYGDEVTSITQNLLAQAEIDNTLAYHNWTDPCPSLTKEQVAMCKGFDYGDKTLKLPCGPLPWPAGLPEPGYVPKTNPLHGRWITVSGGQKAFIKEAIKSGMLGASEAKKIIADTDHEKTGGMYLRISQFGDQCTVDASVAKYARAKRTWRSGHYFYEPLVSGGNLLGVWVLPEEYRKIGFFWEMDSGKCFRIERRAFPVGPYMFLRQSTEVNGKASYVFYAKVSNDPGSKPIPVQSRDYTALAGIDNAPDNLGKPYRCQAKDLDFPKKRDAWLDTNKEAMLDQRDKVDVAFANVCEKGFEAGDNVKGGALNSKQLAKFGDNFKDGLHKPTFHEDGLHAPMEAGGKTYESGFHYLLECHDLGGKNADGGYGGPLCQKPFGDEVQTLTKQILEDSEKDRTLCYNNFMDPCPELTKEQVAICKGFDYGDKTLKLPCGPLPWPAGCPEPGYVPKTNPLHGRWITVSGGQAAFIKEAIKTGMLGAAEANKIQADTDHEKTGGMYLRINQFGDQCTVDASVAKYARAKRTWRSGHYFYEPLVSGGNLLGVWVLPEEYRKIGFFWEMDSGKCFRIERRAFPAGPYTFMRQSTEVAGKISFVLYVKVSNDPESAPIPVQSRDFTALAGRDNVCTNLGKPYPCIAKDLDYPKKRDTWLDKNEKEMIRQRGLVASTFR